MTYWVKNNFYEELKNVTKIIVHAQSGHLYLYITWRLQIIFLQDPQRSFILSCCRGQKKHLACFSALIAELKLPWYSCRIPVCTRAVRTFSLRQVFCNLLSICSLQISYANSRLNMQWESVTEPDVTINLWDAMRATSTSVKKTEYGHWLHFRLLPDNVV